MQNKGEHKSPNRSLVRLDDGNDPPPFRFLYCLWDKCEAGCIAVPLQRFGVFHDGGKQVQKLSNDLLCTQHVMLQHVMLQADETLSTNGPVLRARLLDNSTDDTAVTG